ncbi:MAG TPA: acyltransferase [Bryobacteraceae bacterium]|nr:acyltransferase [Bryobacteraceae bacterium]
MCKVSAPQSERPPEEVPHQSVFTFHHVPELDGLRGIAILLVIMGHSLQYSLTYEESGQGLSTLGVMLFFVLSGFLITSLLESESSRSGSIDLKRFYLRRAFRLTPAFSLFLAVIALLVAARAIVDVPWYEIGASAMYLRNIYGRSSSLGHLWSLSLEEQFYCMWPAVMRFAPAARVLTIAIAATALIAAWRMYAIYAELFPYESGVFYTRPWFRLDSILIGCCLSLAIAKRSYVRGALERVALSVHPLLAWAMLISWSIFGDRVSHVIDITVTMIGALVVVSQIVFCGSHAVSTMLRHRLLTTFGALSYSLYLWQQIFIVSGTSDWGLLKVFPFNLLIIVAISWVSYKCVEIPFLRLRNRFAT